MTRAVRARGCLLGGAVGDALGAPVELLTLAEIRDRYGPSGITTLDTAYGRLGAITDDTQMTLFTAEGLLRWRAAGGASGWQDPRPFLHRAYLRWLDTQQGDVPPARYGPGGGLHDLPTLHSRRGPGHTCLTALRSGRMGTRDRKLNDSKGCGGIMRAAPAGLVNRPDPFALGCDLAAITHSHPSGYLPAGALALLIHQLMQGHPLRPAVGRVLERLEREPAADETVAAVEAATRSADRPRHPHAPDPAAAVEALGGGWVAEEALSIALHCALVHHDDFAAAARLAVNHSGDSDSSGAITGAIVGTVLGPSAIPQEWLEPLELRREIEGIADELVARSRPGDVNGFA